MKPSRLARRFNKKGRQQKKVVIEQTSSTNVEISFIVVVDEFYLIIDRS